MNSRSLGMVIDQPDAGAVSGQGADSPRANYAAAVRSLGESQRLRHRRLEALPLRGACAVFTEVQGRGQGDSFAPAALSDLISSIGEIGLLQPVLVEELVPPSGRPRHRLIAGERRLRAMRWGATAWPQNPHFAALPAIVSPGPLTELERRRWQLAENLARQDLRPGELGAALLLERCALLTFRLTEAGIAVCEDLASMEDTAARFAALERLRGARSDLAAPWREVVGRLGMQLSPRKARAVTAAFRALPQTMTTEMDERQVAAATRSALLRVAADQPETAAELWAAVRDRGRVDLLAAAITARAADSSLNGEQAVDAAQRRHAAANAGRAAKLSARPHPRPDTTPVDDNLLDQVLHGLRRLAAQVRGGRRIDPHTAGSLRLLIDEITGPDPEQRR